MQTKVYQYECIVAYTDQLSQTADSVTTTLVLSDVRRTSDESALAWFWLLEMDQSRDGKMQGLQPPIRGISPLITASSVSSESRN